MSVFWARVFLVLLGCAFGAMSSWCFVQHGQHVQCSHVHAVMCAARAGLYASSCDCTVWCMVILTCIISLLMLARHSCRVAVGQLGAFAGGGLLFSKLPLLGQPPLQETWQLDTALKTQFLSRTHTCTVCMLWICLF
jgi:hypothetical protein